MWFYESVFYQIYPIGFCGAEKENDFKEIRHRLDKIENHIPTLKSLGINAIVFNPLFESERHGYDTIDFFKIDRRLGTNEEFKNLVKKFHDNGIKVVLDGVFNHTGRAFKPFLDVKEKREASQYTSWFNINFGGNTNYNDGFWYENWEGHNELVKLRLDNYDTQCYLMDAVKFWINEFDIDGLRLDVCYLLPEWFLRLLRTTVNELKPDFFLMGEVIHGTNYANNLTDDKLNSITNYECFKGMFSSFNSYNLFEIEYSLTRLFAPLPWTLYKGKHLFNFLDNHDVTRLYTNLTNKNHLLPIYTLLFTIPGIPCIYYGSEYGISGDKGNNDYNLRPCIDDIDKNNNLQLVEHIKKLSKIKKEVKALNYGGYNKVVLNNKYMAFLRECDNEKVIVAINIDDNPVNMNLGNYNGVELLSNKEYNLNEVTVESNSAKIFLVKG